MQGKGAILGVIALLVIAAGIFIFLGKGTPTVSEQSAATDSGTEIATEIAIAPEEEEIIDVAPDTAMTGDEAPTEEEAAAPADTAASETTETETVVEETAAVETAAATTPAAEEAPVASTTGNSLLAAPAALTIDIASATEDRIIGDPNAPLTIIEYASMTCPHCAKFHNEMLPEIKRILIDTGKARLIFRDFPVDNIALKAAMMARCAPKDKYFDLVEVIFKNQERWTKSQQALKSLAQYGNLAGMDDSYIYACMSDTALEAHLLKRLRDAQSLYRVNATPTLIFNTAKAENVKKLSGVDSALEVINTANEVLGKK